MAVKGLWKCSRSTSRRQETFGLGNVVGEQFEIIFHSPRRAARVWIDFKSKAHPKTLLRAFCEGEGLGKDDSD